MVRSLVLDSGLRLIVGRDVVERRGFTAIVLQGFLLAVAGILAFSTLAGVVTARRVLKRIDTINATSAKIMSGNLSERIPITKRNDEFDVLATSLNAHARPASRGLMQGLKEVTDNVAHDLKTPLTRLRTRAEAALRDGSGAEAQREALETTLTESDKLIRTFNALLMIARAEAGAPSGAFRRRRCQRRRRRCCRALRAGRRGGRHDARDHDHAGRASARQSRARRAGAGQPDRERAEILRTGRRQDRPHHHCRAHAGWPGADRGRRQRPGLFRPRIAARVVERFVRLEKSRTEPGSGLGLSLVAAASRASTRASSASRTTSPASWPSSTCRLRVQIAIPTDASAAHRVPFSP